MTKDARKSGRPVIDLGPVRARTLEAWRRGEALPGAEGLVWLERALRLSRADENIRMAVALRRLQCGDPAGAACLFEPMAGRFGSPECWAGLAACKLALGHGADALEALRGGLGGCAVDASLATLAERIAAGQGWCGLRADGVLLTNRPNPRLLLDGRAIAASTMQDGHLLPEGWRNAGLLRVLDGGTEMIGSPIRIWPIVRLDGFVARSGGQISGRAWHPGAPARDPVLRVLDERDACLAELTAHTLGDATGDTPLARMRVFTWDGPARGTLRVVGETGRDLLGSPLPPPEASRHKQPRRRATPKVAEPGLPVDVIIPVYGGRRVTLDCVASVLATVAPPHRVVVVNDASPEPELVADLARLADAGRITLLPSGTPGRNLGFPGAANAGLRHAAGRHAVLLNADTLVAPGWLEALRAACCSAPDIGTATPLSNEATIFSVPRREGGNPAPDLARTRKLAALAASVFAPEDVVEVPTAHGFCMFIRADCLAQTGLLDAMSFAQGYGEENDFTERARALGWRHVAVPCVFVAHLGSVSFGDTRARLLERNLAILDERYPAYRARVAAHIAADPLARARRALDLARWRDRWAADGGGRGAVLLITHALDGGTARVVRERAAAARAESLEPIVLRPDGSGLCGVDEDFPNLACDLPGDLRLLTELLRLARPLRAEVHHLLGHHHSVMQLMAALAIPYEVWVHDYAWFCARLAFVTGDGFFCGEADTNTCDACVKRWGTGLEERIRPARLRARSAADLLGATRVVVAARDVARRVARHAPGVVADLRPWQQDPPWAPPTVRSAGVPARVVVVGGIGLEKGMEVLLACARDAAARALDLEFIVVGYTSDDDALMATGRAFITGAFSHAEVLELIRAQGAHLAFLPSIWPETWCFALSDAWSAGLSVAVFDIGVPAERIREAGRGWILPLGLPAGALNDWFIRTAASA